MKPVPMKPRELWAVVDGQGIMIVEEMWLSAEQAEQAIKCCRLRNARVAKILLTEVV